MMVSSLISQITIYILYIFNVQTALFPPCYNVIPFYRWRISVHLKCASEVLQRIVSPRVACPITMKAVVSTITRFTAFAHTIP